MDDRILKFLPPGGALPAVPACLAIGVFDGVHGGHRDVLQAAVGHGTATDLPVVALTFDPHPDAVVSGKSVPLITSLDERIAHLHAAGADSVLSLSFTDIVAEMSEHAFIDALSEVLDIRRVFVGEGFRYGHRGAGDIKTLTAHGQTHGFSVCVVPKRWNLGAPTSSTRIRDAITAGALDEAAALLGRPYSVTLHANDSPQTVWDACYLLPEDRVCPAAGGYLARLVLPGTDILIATHIEPGRIGGILQLSLRGGHAVPMPHAEPVTLEFLRPLWGRSDVDEMVASALKPA